MSNYGTPNDPNNPNDPYGQQGGQPYGEQPYGQQGAQGQPYGDPNAPAGQPYGDPNQPQGYGDYDKNQYGQGQYDQSQYGGAAPAYDPNQGGYAGTMAPVENKKANTALILSCVGVFCGILAIVGIVLGVQSKKEIQQSGGTQTGAGKAQAAIIIGAVILVLNVIFGIIQATKG
ncbi:DUF4190 domain-containing protein [Calidifontibacter sp. DB0510]|uniref:DUF4190 domain-containing protein n=1 Tax=Metallococcus carri TaxID=1656884 RepID=A0A967B179_9MICO|nr:DUF4190 domain-containing protein [Metallococcus carri]NHN55535.1 DUF4190 domain-containing protein [Metallococcus carri]NOP38281.1 DUF4190 domain-containing protein [Calidifontibacter sp. DB2511S]